ncbi:hypothetical protein [Antrihabitans sp. YC2-6]|uniref:hypothetical protein n=1 Tax=Antrihabitans sp. YC2-6 TaxID=2799498 RepID=UPI0018F56947|nr:hypothetical protein [Antrihabitans sp. YC2-6]MBJ8348534.1 hypothetical protein [Antrihabitans sp. YC2-6]
MDIVVLRCGDGPVPITLLSHHATVVSAVPGAAEFEELFPTLDALKRPRLVVLGDDAALAASLTWLMRTERLSVEVAHVPVEASPAARIYKTGTGAEAANRALNGTATELPLIRDDRGNVLVGSAIITGPRGAALEGEAYVDDTRMFTGLVAALHIEPTVELPGLRSFVDTGKRFRRKRWVAGRAMQLGTRAAVISRDSVSETRTVKRSAFYRHHEPWLLVR